MRYLFEKIKYSEFYKTHIKELTFTKYLRKLRDVFVILRKKWQGWRDPKRRAPELLATLEQYLLPSEEVFAAAADSSVRPQIAEEPVDVIIPIYNGYDYLVRLFEDLPKAGMPCRFILVDDKSPDERVRPLEEAFVAGHPGSRLLENDKNYGFVKTVNSGLAVCTGHVALVNTDTELPEGWLKRLMAPILSDPRVASSTPFTNSGTIFSFPNFGYNNEIYLGMDVDVVDAFFRQIRPRYVETPTGVGFCMGMNRRAIDAVGDLDYEAFDRGFGEENDWCQRAKKKGYKNVQVENLFVYHKHGGSFISEEKEQLLQAHLDLLHKRYPTYDYQVRKYLAKDPNQEVRRIIRMVIDTHRRESFLYFAHDMGGGAAAYLDREIERLVAREKCVSVIRYLTMQHKYQFQFFNAEGMQEYVFTHMEELLDIGKWLAFDEIVINELVTYPDLMTAQQLIITCKKQHACRLTMLFHDYFALCPGINLLNGEGQLCEGSSAEACEACYKKQGYDTAYGCATRADWLKCWRSFLEACTEVRCFSEDTRARVERIFGKGLALSLVPHQVEYAFPIHKDFKTTDTINIGLLGVLAKHKGGEVVRRLLEEIERQNLNINIILVGWTDGVNLKKYRHFRETGKYQAQELPRLIYQNDIDVFLIASIWPETFSYTAEEIIRMGMPLVSYDLGAPGERIKKYDKGMVLPLAAGSEKMLELISDFAKKHVAKGRGKVSRPKLIFVAEYLSFSSRYRLEHLMEELLFQGVPGAFYAVGKIPKRLNWKELGGIVVYRCRYQGAMRRLIEEAKEHQVPVYYDIDDLIFDREQMDYMPEFDAEVYGDFAGYADAVRECMERADKILVSTNHMEQAVKRALGQEKPVYVNRNQASSQMLILSGYARSSKPTHGQKVVLGYFSGSNTHNEDFALIAEVIREVMEKYPRVELLIVGCMELPQMFAGVEDRIRRREFLPWQELPAVIASVDINLMPLQDTFFHRCKSENKWMEAALVEVPTVATYNTEIAAVTRSGQDIILCKTKDDWRRELECMIAGEGYRKEIAANARRHVVEQRTTLCKDEKLLKFFEER